MDSGKKTVADRDIGRYDSISIRRAHPEDAQALYRAEYATSLTPGLLVSRPDELSAAAFAEKIRWLNTAGIYAVAEAGGRPVGHALLEPGSLRAMSHVFSLTIVVHPGHTGQGVGTALMRFLLDWAQENPVVERIELRVREGNVPAQRLYARFGFIEEARLQNRIRLEDGSRLADILMARLLPR